MKTALKQHAWLIGVTALYLGVAALTANNLPTWAPQSQQVNPDAQSQPTAVVHASSASATVHPTDCSTRSEATGDCPTSSEPSPIPPASQGETFHTVEQQHDVLQSLPVQDFPATPLGRQLQAHMVSLEALGPDAEEEYQLSLEALRDTPDTATTLLTDAYTQMAEERYLDRWKVVDTLATLQSEHALAALAEIARMPIPEERSPSGHGVSSHSQEVMIRNAAIRGVAELAQSGMPEAEQVLRDLVGAEDERVREIAILAYLHTGADLDQRMSELRARLAPEDQWMLHIEPINDISLLPDVSPVDELPQSADRH